MNTHQVTISSLIVFSLFFWSNVQAETWRLTSLAWEPYSGDDLPHQGSSIEILKNILKKEGIELVVEFYPWKRAQLLANTEKYVGYFPAWPEEVGKDFTASPAIDWSLVGILGNKDIEVQYETIDQLYANFKVGTVSTYTYPDVIKHAMEKYPQHVFGAPHEEALLKSLSNNRTQVAITDPKVMMFLADKYKITNVTPIQPVIKKELVIAFNNLPTNRAHLEQLLTILEKHNKTKEQETVNANQQKSP